MTPTRSTEVTIRLNYVSTGPDDPERQVFRNFVADPTRTEELVVAVRDDEHPEQEVFRRENVRPQIHLAGTAAALEELGRFLVALARLETLDPEPYSSVSDVLNADGGNARLVIRRVRLPPRARSG